jgi:hypothetical protein
MTVSSWESYLLLITLILAVVSLFLCLFNALLLFDVSKRITRLMSRSRLPKMEGHPGTSGQEQLPFATKPSDGIKLRVPLQEYEDIATGIQTIAGKYHIDSLVVAMPDGLVVASAGSNDPEYDAAHYSSLFKGGYTTPEPGIWLLPLDHHGVPLIGIARSRDTLPDEMTSRITEDLKLLFERGL